MSKRLWDSKVMRQRYVYTLIIEKAYDRIGHVRICGVGALQSVVFLGFILHKKCPFGQPMSMVLCIEDKEGFRC